MTKFGLATVAAVVAAGSLGMATPAAAAPSGSTNAQTIINSLEAQGYHVVVNRRSERSLAEADVVAIDRGAGIAGAALLFGPVDNTTVYVDVS